MATTLEVVLSMKERPGIICGESPSLEVMWAYLTGLEFGNRLPGKSLLGFTEWFEKREGLDEAADIFAPLREGASEAEAVVRLLSQYAEYLAEGDESGNSETASRICPHCGAKLE